MMHLRLLALPNTNRWQLLLLVAGSLLLAAVTAYEPLAGIGLALGLGAILGAAYLVCRPWHLFALYLFLLPAHVVTMAILLVHAGLPAGAVKIVSSWKELVLLLFLAVAAGRFALRPRWQATWPDIFLLAYFAYAVVYFLFAVAESRPLTVTLYGLRDLTLPVLIYIVGRSVPLSEKRARTIFHWMLWLALLTSVVGIVESQLLPTKIHIDLGIPRYYQELLGIDFGAYYSGLPENYWRATSSTLLRRAASIYGSSQSFALSFLLLLPFSLYAMFTRRLGRQGFATLVFLFSFAGLLLTITRFTIVIGMGLIALAGLLTSRLARRLAGVGLVLLALLFAAAMVGSSQVRGLVITTLTFQDHSTSSRLNIWSDTVEVVGRRPEGYGISAVGQTANRFAGEIRAVVGIEGQISKIGVELGLLGLLLYLALLLSLIFFLLAAHYRLREPHLRGLCFVMALTFVGLLLNAVTTEWHNSIALVYPAWWLAGSCVTYAVEQRRRELAAVTPAERGG